MPDLPMLLGAFNHRSPNRSDLPRSFPEAEIEELASLLLRWLKNPEQHRQDKRPRGPSTPRNKRCVTRQTRVRRSAQDDDFEAF